MLNDKKTKQKKGANAYSVSNWITGLNIISSFVIGGLLLMEFTYLKNHRQFGTERVDIVLDTIFSASDSTITVEKRRTFTVANVGQQANSTLDTTKPIAEKSSLSIEKSKPLLDFLDIIWVMLLAGALGGVLCNLRGIFSYHRDIGELPDYLHIPYISRPFAAAICGVFVYFVSSMLVTSITLTPLASGISFQGMISYTALAILAGFGAQEFMERLKELARTIFGDHRNENYLPKQPNPKSDLHGNEQQLDKLKPEIVHKPEEVLEVH